MTGSWSFSTVIRFTERVFSVSLSVSDDPQFT